MMPNAQEGSNATLDRSTSLSFNGIVRAPSSNDHGTQVCQVNRDNTFESSLETSPPISKPASDPKLNDMNSMHDKIRYVSSPVVGGTFSQGKIFAGQSQLAVSKSTSMLADTNASSKFNPSPMARGHGTVNLDRCLSRSTPGLFDHCGITSPGTSDRVSNILGSHDNLPSCTNHTPVNIASMPSGRKANCRSRNHGRLMQDGCRKEGCTSRISKRRYGGRRNIPYSSRTIRPHILGQADLAGGYGDLTEGQVYLGNTESAVKCSDTMHNENTVSQGQGNERQVNALGQADLVGVSQMSNLPNQNSLSDTSNGQISYC